MKKLITCMQDMPGYVHVDIPDLQFGTIFNLPSDQPFWQGWQVLDTFRIADGPVIVEYWPRVTPVMHPCMRPYNPDDFQNKRQRLPDPIPVPAWVLDVCDESELKKRSRKKGNG